MDIKLLLIVSGTVFIAELGDKTQFATLLFAADKEASKLTIFFAACAALIASSAIAVMGGALVARYLNESHLRLFAGSLFIVIGCWTLWRAKS